MAACMKLGSKSDVFQRRGQAWFCTTGLPSDIVIEVDEMLFHLHKEYEMLCHLHMKIRCSYHHKFPLMSRSGTITRILAESTTNSVNCNHGDHDDEEGCRVCLSGVPGGPVAFELAAKFCYGVKLELTCANAAVLRCAAEYLEMTEDYSGGGGESPNLAAQAEAFLAHILARGTSPSIVSILRSCDCDDEILLQYAEDLLIVKRCIDAIASRVGSYSAAGLFGWPVRCRRSSLNGGPLQSPGGTLLWNGISTGAKPKSEPDPDPDWWHDDIASLRLPLFARLISALEYEGAGGESIARGIMHYACKSLPGLNRRHGSQPPRPIPPSFFDQKSFLEAIESLLPRQKGVSPTHFLFGLLRIAMILNAGVACKRSLESRIGEQLELSASLEDLLIPNYSHDADTLYDTDCVQRILNHFRQTHYNSTLNATANSPRSFDDDAESPTLAPIRTVAKLVDSYLAEIVPDPNLKPAKFQELAEVLPDCARTLDDGLYRAIDIYLKAHPWLSEKEKERVCCIMNCQKLSLEACTHAAQNERLPLRIVVQVLFFEQLQLRAAMTGSYLAADNTNLDPNPIGAGDLYGIQASPVVAGVGGNSAIWDNNLVLKMDMEHMRARVLGLEKECSAMRHEIRRYQKPKGFSSSWNAMARRFGCKYKPDICKSQEKIVAVDNSSESSRPISEDWITRHSKHKRSTSLS